ARRQRRARLRPHVMIPPLHVEHFPPSDVDPAALLGRPSPALPDPFPTVVSAFFISIPARVSTRFRKVFNVQHKLAWIFLICHHLNSRLLHFLPKKLVSLLLPSCWHPPTSKDGASPPATALSSISTFRSASFGPRASGRVMDPSELKRVFQMFDRNGDGRITKTELSDSLENLGIYIPEAELASMIEKIDVNGDGCVDMDEFGALYRSIMDERDEEEDMREAFNVFDQNGDGYISVEELRSVLVSLGVKQGRTAEDCRMMINKVDVDGDGRVDFMEFKQMMKGGGFAALGLEMDISFEDGKRLWSLMWNKEELITRKRRFLMGSASTSEGSPKKLKRPKLLTESYLPESYVRNDDLLSKQLKNIIGNPIYSHDDKSLHNTPTSSHCLSYVSNMLEELDEMSYQELTATSRKLRGVSLLPQFPPARCSGNRGLLIKRVKKRFNKLLSKLKDGDALPEPLVKALSIIYLSYKHRSRHVDMLTSEFYPFPPETVDLHNDIMNALWLLPKVKHGELKALHTLMDPKAEVPLKCFRNALRKYLMEYLFECSETSITQEALRTIDFINRKMHSQTLVFSKETIQEEVEAALIASRRLKQMISNIFSERTDKQCFVGFGDDKNINSFNMVGTDYFMGLVDNEHERMYSSCSNYEEEATGESGPGVSRSFTTSSNSFLLTGTGSETSGNSSRKPEVEHDNDFDIEKPCLEESEKLTPERTSQNTGNVGVKSVEGICDETTLVAYKLIGSMLDKLLKTEGIDADMSIRIYLNGGSSASVDLQVAKDLLKTSKEHMRSIIFVQTVEELIPSLTKSCFRSVKNLMES
ncbi:hypothetical protein MUK42_06858, partial [Musa troglodytarum]